MGGDEDPDRRKFLKLATCGLGGVVGLATVGPTLSLVLDPARRQTVTTPKDPIDIGAASTVRTEWKKFDVVAPVLRNAWTSARNVVLGGAYVRAVGQNIEALSAVCPHLGCPVGWTGSAFGCPCHDSTFAIDGKTSGKGPAKRGLDPLPVQVVDGRLRLTWIRYRLDIGEREPV